MDFYVGFSEYEEHSPPPTQKAPCHAGDHEDLQGGEGWRGITEPMTDCFPLIMASETEAVSLSDSLFLQQKLINVTEKERTRKEHTDVGALEGTGSHTAHTA